MAKTYHDAPITAAQFDKVLASMNSVSKASNNGKILCVDDFGFLTAKTQQELHIGAVLEPVTINENGTVTPPEGVDGFDSVTVNVQGSAPVLQNKIVTQNGVVTPDTGYDGLGQVTVDVPSSGYPEPTGTIPITANGTVNVKDYASAEVNVPTGITAADEGKVVKNGVLVAQTARATEITVNGTYDTTENNSVTVNVSGGGGGAVVQPLSVTQNGTYNPPSGVDGYAPVTVNVSGGGTVDDWTNLKNYIESNGTQYINTGYSVKDNSKFEVIANPSTTQPTYGTIFGTRASNSDGPGSYSCILAAAWSSNRGNLNWGSSINRLTNLDKGNKTKYSIQKDRGIVFESESLEGIIGFAVTGSTQSATTADLMLFTLGVNGSDYGSVTHCNMKLYRFRIYEGDTLVHEYLPWQENGVACLKDTVTSNLLYNAGTGNFVYGTDT